jgi:hypothetical protein
VNFKMGEGHAAIIGVMAGSGKCAAQKFRMYRSILSGAAAFSLRSRRVLTSRMPALWATFGISMRGGGAVARNKPQRAPVAGIRCATFSQAAFWGSAARDGLSRRPSTNRCMTAR